MKLSLFLVGPVLVGTLVAAGLWYLVQPRPEAGAIPQEVAGHRLLRVVKGGEAAQMLASMHQKAPQLAEASIAYYEHGGTVWIGTTASPQAALAQLQAMAQAIGRGATPFFGLRELRLEGQRVFTVSDTYASHFFAQAGARVLWVTPPAGGGTGFVAAVFRKL